MWFFRRFWAESHTPQSQVSQRNSVHQSWEQNKAKTRISIGNTHFSTQTDQRVSWTGQQMEPLLPEPELLSINKPTTHTMYYTLCSGEIMLSLDAGHYILVKILYISCIVYDIIAHVLFNYISHCKTEAFKSQVKIALWKVGLWQHKGNSFILYSSLFKGFLSLFSFEERT